MLNRKTFFSVLFLFVFTFTIVPAAFAGGCSGVEGAPENAPLPEKFIAWKMEEPDYVPTGRFAFIRLRNPDPGADISFVDAVFRTDPDSGKIIKKAGFEGMVEYSFFTGRFGYTYRLCKDSGEFYLDRKGSTDPPMSIP